jgi:DNA-binding response OmpR family regulator
MAALLAAAEKRPSAIVLDAREDCPLAAQLCLSLRSLEQLSGVPVIALTREEARDERLLMLEAGADVCFLDDEGRELVARLAKIERSSRKYNSNKVLRMDDLELDLDRYTIRSKSGFAHLSVLQLEVLRYLIERAGIVVSRRELLENVWRNTELNERAVTRHVARIRRALKSTHSSVVIRGLPHTSGYVLRASER